MLGPHPGFPASHLAGKRLGDHWGGDGGRVGSAVPVRAALPAGRPCACACLPRRRSGLVKGTVAGSGEHQGSPCGAGKVAGWGVMRACLGLPITQECPRPSTKGLRGTLSQMLKFGALKFPFTLPSPPGNQASVRKPLRLPSECGSLGGGGEAGSRS